MTMLCTDKYLNDNYNEYFKLFDFELSDFQKHAIEGIINKKNVLITAHTGSGKTLPAEFAIMHYAKENKKIIYTTPIKALSNQKYSDFQKKFPNISFGIVTGDKQENVDANVIIMTTEILRDILRNKINEKENKSLFELNLDDIEYVVFDEVHFFNDSHRGTVYEETFMTIPNNIKLLMLSATLDRPEKFANWIEETHKTETYIIPTNFRIVPLKHYQYITLQQSEITKIKDKILQTELKLIINKQWFIKSTDETFDSKIFDEHYKKIKRIKEYISEKKIYISSKFVLNEIAKKLYETEQFPAICFIFSKKKVEEYALEIEKNLFEDDSKNTYIVRDKCIEILQKLPNYNKLITLPQFDVLTKLLEKGVAMHHSGMLPIFKELVEVLYNQGFVKLLFATETFSVGINAPTKTVIFTNFTKFSGNTFRLLQPSEYTQMAGRAGRRGIDKLGNIIHLNNLFDLPMEYEYKTLLNGKPQVLTSKFSISYNLVLNILDSNKNCVNYLSNSMVQTEINTQVSILQKEKDDINNNLSLFIPSKDSTIIIYNEIKNKLDVCTNLNQKKKIQKKHDELKKKLTQIEIDKYNKYLNFNKEYIIINNNIKNIENSLITDIKNIIHILNTNNFIDNNDILQSKGHIALGIKIVNPLILTELLIETNYFNNLTSYEIVGLISCFMDLKIPLEQKSVFPKINNIGNNNSDNKINTSNLEENINILVKLNNKYDGDNDLCFDLINYTIDWCYSENENESKLIIQNILESFHGFLFLGDIYEIINKINNIVNELLKINYIEDKIEFINKLTLISELLLKSIMSNYSLYV
jgi:superfamily II RNA helicase